MTMSAAKEVGAKFAPVKNAKVNVVGSGSVSSKPGGVGCTPSCTSQTAAFAQGSTVELVQKPAKHFEFTGWSGDCTGKGACSLTMSAAKEVTATFTEVSKTPFSVAKSGGGTAQIKTKPTGINCGFTCERESASFYQGEPVEVSWKLNKGNHLNRMAHHLGYLHGQTRSHRRHLHGGPQRLAIGDSRIGGSTWSNQPSTTT